MRVRSILAACKQRLFDFYLILIFFMLLSVP